MLDSIKLGICSIDSKDISYMNKLSSVYLNELSGLDSNREE